MHLDNKSLLTLSSPFIVAGGLWFFSDTFIGVLSNFFESAQLSKTSVLEHQGESYRYITDHKGEYSSLLNKIRVREENRWWICERLFSPYILPTTQTSLVDPLRPPPPLIPFGEGNISAPTSITWSVQMVLPEQNTAIINNQIYHVGQSRDGVKLLEVTPSKIYIQTPKGKQWVKLFH